MLRLLTRQLLCIISGSLCMEAINTTAFMAGKQSYIIGANMPTGLSNPLGIYHDWTDDVDYLVQTSPWTIMLTVLLLLHADLQLHSSYAPSVNTRENEATPKNLMKYRSYAISWLMVSSADYALAVAPHYCKSHFNEIKTQCESRKQCNNDVIPNLLALHCILNPKQVMDRPPFRWQLWAHLKIRFAENWNVYLTLFCLLQ